MGWIIGRNKNPQICHFYNDGEYKVVEIRTVRIYFRDCIGGLNEELVFPYPHAGFTVLQANINPPLITISL